jgi:NADH-quinone oxidoreductase subunit J
MLEQIVFYTFSTMLVFSAIMVISVRNPVHSALFLVLSFFSSAAIWLLLEAEFLAIALILVYVGAVMVLFLFVVMMLDINVTTMREGFARFLPVGIGVALLMVISMGLIVGSDFFQTSEQYQPVVHAADYSNTEAIGLKLFTDFLYPFEIAGAILLVAIIAAIALTMRKPKNIKTPKPEAQVAVKKGESRVRLVKMEAERKQ